MLPYSAAAGVEQTTRRSDRMGGRDPGGGGFWRTSLIYLVSSVACGGSAGQIPHVQGTSAPLAHLP